MHVETVGGLPPRAPEWAVPLLARKSGYVQTVHPELLLPVASQAGVTICLRPRVGQHVIAGTMVGWVWAPTADDPRPDPEPFEQAVNADVRIGFERTLEQDVAFGIRQQLDICLQGAVARDQRPLHRGPGRQPPVRCPVRARGAAAGGGHPDRLHRSGPRGGARATPSGTTCSSSAGCVGRYGAHDVTVMTALSHLVRACTEVLPPGSDRLKPLHQAAGGILVDAKRGMVRPSDVESIRRTTESLLVKITAKQAAVGTPSQWTTRPPAPRRRRTPRRTGRRAGPVPPGAAAAPPNRSSWPSGRPAWSRPG